MNPESHLYDVHLFAVVRRKLRRIAAASPAAAVVAARDDAAVGYFLQRFDDAEGLGDFADEFTHYLVDVVGDAEFEQSCWFHAEETPLLQILRTLVRWDETGRDADVLRELLEEVRHILSRSL